MEKGRRKGGKLAIKASAMTFRSPNADAARWKRNWTSRRQSYVFFNVADLLEAQRLIDLRTHFWQEHIKGQMLSVTFDPRNRMVAGVGAALERKTGGDQDHPTTAVEPAWEAVLVVLRRGSPNSCDGRELC